MNARPFKIVGNAGENLLPPRFAKLPGNPLCSVAVFLTQVTRLTGRNDILRHVSTGLRDRYMVFLLQSKTNVEHRWPVPAVRTGAVPVSESGVPISFGKSMGEVALESVMAVAVCTMPFAIILLPGSHLLTYLFGVCLSITRLTGFCSVGIQQPPLLCLLSICLGVLCVAGPFACTCSFRIVPSPLSRLNAITRSANAGKFLAVGGKKLTGSRMWTSAQSAIPDMPWAARQRSTQRGAFFGAIFANGVVGIVKTASASGADVRLGSSVGYHAQSRAVYATIFMGINERFSAVRASVARSHGAFLSHYSEWMSADAGIRRHFGLQSLADTLHYTTHKRRTP